MNVFGPLAKCLNLNTARELAKELAVVVIVSAAVGAMFGFAWWAWGWK